MEKLQVEEMFDDMKRAFEELLRETEWMDNATRTRAEDKLKMIRPYIAYPNYIKNNVSIIIDYYKNVCFSWFLDIWVSSLLLVCTKFIIP